MSLALIAAIAKNNCIGIKNQLPWNLPEDLKHFKDLTMGKTVLMGRNTWLSLPQKFRPLPGRKNVVISFDPIDDLPSDVRWFNSLDTALRELKNEDVFVTGGAMIYKQTIDHADTLYITHVHRIVDGDVFFPVIDTSKWKEVEREKLPEFDFVKYTRVQSR